MKHDHQEPSSGRTRAESRKARAGRLRIRVSGSAVGLAALGAIALGACSGPSHPASSGLPAGTQVFPEKVHTHTTGSVHYNRNPPAGGPHSPVWLNCGIYAAPVPNTNAVHSMEHGAVWITYRPTLPSSQVTLLRQLVPTLYDGAQRYVILSPYPGLPAPIVVSTWGAQLRVPNVSDPGLVAFIRHFEGGSQGGEPGGPCTGGVGTPIG